MAYQKQTWNNDPSGETPITAERLNHIEDGIASAVETDSVARVSNVVSKNLFNKNNLYKGYRLGSDGNLFADTTYSATDFIIVSPNKTYIANWDVSALECICYYDETKTFISRNINTNPFTVPNNCKYIKVSRLTSNISTTQIEDGIVITSYVPYLNLEELQNLSIKTPNGNTQITKLELGYRDGWVLVVSAISDGQVVEFIANLTQINS